MVLVVKIARLIKNGVCNFPWNESLVKSYTKYLKVSSGCRSTVLSGCRSTDFNLLGCVWYWSFIRIVRIIAT